MIVYGNGNLNNFCLNACKKDEFVFKLYKLLMHLNLFRFVQRARKLFISK